MKQIIRNVYAQGDGKYESSNEEFKKWFKKFDSDRDGRITMEELQKVIEANSSWFSKWLSKSKAKRGMKLADENSNGVIDENEMAKLVDFARKELSLDIVA